MLKKFLLIFSIVLTFATQACANDLPISENREQDTSIIDISELDPDLYLPLANEPEQTVLLKLQLLKEYLLLEVELAKEHIIDHKKAYLVAGSIALLGAISGGAIYLTKINKKS